MQERILFLCSHNDDQLVGAGGTIAKYSKEGKKIVTIIFSFGEFSMPHMQEKITRKTRVLESRRASKIIGESEVCYLGLTEGQFGKEIEEKKIYDKIKYIVKKINPSKIFTHSIDDPHPDHRAVYYFTIKLAEKMVFSGELYSFNIWNFFLNLKSRHLPKLVVDVSETFKLKVEALNKHKSQLPAIMALMWSIYAQALWNGIESNARYAEVFYKVK